VVWSAFVNVPDPMIWVQLAGVVRSATNSRHWPDSGMKPTLYCQKLPGSVTPSVPGGRPSAKWISSASGALTSLSHTRTCVMPAATQSPVYWAPLDMVPSLPATGFATWRKPSPAPFFPPVPGLV